jgi:uncharacterized protein
MIYDEKFVHFIVLFNCDRDYFECHEVMEELWLEEGRNRFYQGLLQVAVGLHHWHNDNLSGAVKLFAAALEKLEPAGDIEHGLDLKQLKADTQHALDQLQRAAEAEPPAFRSFDIRVLDAELEHEVGLLAAIPLEERLHAGK